MIPTFSNALLLSNVNSNGTLCYTQPTMCTAQRSRLYWFTIHPPDGAASHGQKQTIISTNHRWVGETALQWQNFHWKIALTALPVDSCLNLDGWPFNILNNPIFRGLLQQPALLPILVFQMVAMAIEDLPSFTGGYLKRRKKLTWLDSPIQIIRLFVILLVYYAVHSAIQSEVGNLFENAFVAQFKCWC